MTISVMVTGSRDLEDRDLVEGRLARLMPEQVRVGCCPTGVDRIVREWCARNLQPHQWAVFSADWRRLGKRAGPVRNRRLVRWAKENSAIVLAFPRGGPGTAHCIELAKRVGLHVGEH